MYVLSHPKALDWTSTQWSMPKAAMSSSSHSTGTASVGGGIVASGAGRCISSSAQTWTWVSISIGAPHQAEQSTIAGAPRGYQVGSQCDCGQCRREDEHQD